MAVLALDILLLGPLGHLRLRPRRAWGHILQVGWDTLLIHDLLLMVVGSRVSLIVGEVLRQDMLILFHFGQKLLKMTCVGCQV